MERSLENFDITKRPLEYSYSLLVLEFQVRPDTFGLLKVSVAVSLSSTERMLGNQTIIF